MSAEEDNSYPALPLRDVVVYPHMVIPLFVGREKSVKALDQAMEGNKKILLVAQKSAADDDPTIVFFCTHLPCFILLKFLINFICIM